MVRHLGPAVFFWCRLLTVGRGLGDRAKCVQGGNSQGLSQGTGYIIYGKIKRGNLHVMRQAALGSHPDKVPEEEREAAEVKFKMVQQAYDILYDEEKRHLYDTHGMGAFNGSGDPGMGAGPDLDDILAQMFGGMGGMGGMPGGARPKKPRRSPNEEQKYEVSLEDLYKGRTVKFASTKNVICSLCKGKGGKEKAQAKKCSTCDGQGKMVFPFERMSFIY